MGKRKVRSEQEAIRALDDQLRAILSVAFDPTKLSLVRVTWFVCYSCILLSII
jgi:hypothetical protein